MRKPTPNLRERALGYLTRREYSRQELYRKLLPYAGEEDLDGLLEEFRQRGWISDARYADQMVHARKGKYGSRKVAHELRRKRPMFIGIDGMSFCTWRKNDVLMRYVSSMSATVSSNC